MELLLGLAGLLRLVLRLQLTPQSLEGGLLSLPAPQLSLQILQTTTDVKDGDGGGLAAGRGMCHNVLWNIPGFICLR